MINSLSVNWVGSARPDIPSTESYDLRYRKGTTGDWDNGPQNVTRNWAIIDGLDPSAEYQVQVRATNEDGDSDWSEIGSGSTNAAITSIAFTSDPGDDDTYRIDDAIQVTVTFSAAVTVSGTPQFALDVGGAPRTADYESGTGSTDLVFSYTVAEGDEDTDGVAVEKDEIALNGGTIQVGTTDAALTHAAEAADPEHKVDGIRPRLASATVAANGTSIDLVFDEPYDNLGAVNLITSGGTPSVTADGSSVTGQWRIVRDADLKHRTLQLHTLSPTITYGQVVIVSYTDPHYRRRRERPPGRGRQPRRLVHHRLGRRPRRRQQRPRTSPHHYDNTGRQPRHTNQQHRHGHLQVRRRDRPGCGVQRGGDGDRRPAAPTEYRW